MERERFTEMTKNLKQLSEAGVLGLDGTAGVSVFLFAHCGATMELADELFKMGIRPSAILDNNPDKYGLDYKGIPVCEPQVAVNGVNTTAEPDKGAESEEEKYVGAERGKDAIILIVSRFYEQMASQMRGLGFKGRIDKLTDYNTYAEYSLSPDTLIRKSERLNRGLERLKRIKNKHPGAFVVFCPFPALGDVYFCMSYLKPYMTLNGYDKCLVCVVGNAQKQVVELFDYAYVLKLEQKDMDEAIQAVIYTDDPECYIVHQDRPYVVDLHRALYKKCIPLETVYKCGIFGLSQDTEPVEPVNWEEFKYPTASLCSGEDGKDGRAADEKDTAIKTVIISPYAKSVALLPESLWSDLVDDLTERGYEIYTNVVGDEKQLEGTKPISPTIAEMKTAVEQAELFIGIRSGMCDVIKTAGCRKIALYPDYYYCDTKWKSIDIYSIEGFENIVIKDGDTWEEVKKRVKL